MIAALGGENLVGGPATVFDMDNDGDLDIYITYFGNYLKGELPTLKRYNTNGSPNQLFENLGNFTSNQDIWNLKKVLESAGEVLPGGCDVIVLFCW